MNLTVFSLVTTKLLKPSSFIVVGCNENCFLGLSNAKFSTSSFVFSTFSNNIILSRMTFSRFLQAPICINSILVSNEEFYSRQYYNNVDSLDVTHCKFVNCFSSTTPSSAICVERSSCVFGLSDSLFQNCSSTYVSGFAGFGSPKIGSVGASCKDFSGSRNCFSMDSHKGTVLMGYFSNLFNLSSSQFFRVGTEQGSSCNVHKGSIYFTFCNFSHTKNDVAIHIGSYANDGYVSYSNFNGITSTLSTLDFSSSTSAPSRRCQYSNIINNTQPYIIGYYSKSHEITRCSFIKNTGSLCISRVDGTILFNSCVSDTTYTANQVDCSFGISNVPVNTLESITVCVSDLINTAFLTRKVHFSLFILDFILK